MVVMDTQGRQKTYHEIYAYMPRVHLIQFLYRSIYFPLVIYMPLQSGRRLEALTNINSDSASFLFCCLTHHAPGASELSAWSVPARLASPACV